jgi:hypothetical protein
VAAATEVTAVSTGATAAADQLEERRSAPFLTGDPATDLFPTSDGCSSISPVISPTSDGGSSR